MRLVGKIINVDFEKSQGCFMSLTIAFYVENMQKTILKCHFDELFTQTWIFSIRLVGKIINVDFEKSRGSFF